MPEIKRLQALNPYELDELVRESQQQGFSFLFRLVADYESGANRFERSGEALFGLFDAPALIGIGGLNIDPYRADPRVGRVRHLYIAHQWREHGMGKLLVNAIIAEARKQFHLLTLRTDTTQAAAFYEALGFHRAVANTNDSHFLPLSSSWRHIL